MSAEPRVTVGIPTYNRSAMLSEAIRSVLVQTYPHFRLLISDNASEDDTEDVVRSFDDERIDYVRAPRNVGMIANLNKVIELTRSEYLVLLNDDDLLYPDHLKETVEALDAHPELGFVHTGFDQIDADGRRIGTDIVLAEGEGPLLIETGARYLERSMRSPWMFSWSSIVFRMQALREADGLREHEEPFADFPLLMRIACRWDVACVPHTLSASRKHAEAVTAAIGAWTGARYDLLERQPKILYRHRLGLLQEMPLPDRRARRYRSVARRTFNRDRVYGLAEAASSGAPTRATLGALARLVGDDRRVLLLPDTWRLCVAELGGRAVRRRLGRLVRAAVARPHRSSGSHSRGARTHERAPIASPED